jgi:hypothetical protein
MEFKGKHLKKDEITKNIFALLRNCNTMETTLKFKVFATGGQSASSSWSRVSFGAHDNILIFLV